MFFIFHLAVSISWGENVFNFHNSSICLLIALSIISPNSSSPTYLFFLNHLIMSENISFLISWSIVLLANISVKKLSEANELFHITLGNQVLASTAYVVKKEYWASNGVCLYISWVV